MITEKLYTAYDYITFEGEDETVEADIIVLTLGNKSRLYMQLENGDYFWLTTETTLEKGQEPTVEDMQNIINRMVEMVKETFTDEKLNELYTLDYEDSANWSRDFLANYILQEQMF